LKYNPVLQGFLFVKKPSVKTEGRLTIACHMKEFRKLFYYV